MRQGRYRIAWLFFILLFVVILGGAWLYTNWQSSQTVLPPELTINDQPMGGMTREQALKAIELAYTHPITVYYANKLTPLLLPEMVELTLDAEATAENLDEALAARTKAHGFTAYIVDLILGREPEVLAVNAIVTYSRERIDAFLARTAQKYDHPPQRPVALPEAGTFRPPQDGTTLDAKASLPLLIEAILAADPKDREVHLVVDIEPVPEASISILEQAIQASLADFTGVAGIFAKDFHRGREMCLNCDVTFSGLSLPKIAIALELYRLLDAAPDAETDGLIGAMLADGDNAAADRLLAQIGAGNPYSGALQVTDLLWSLGLKHSFITEPYVAEETVAPPGVAGLATAQADIFTDPDPVRQTTPTEMGLLLEGLYQCAQGGGFLRIIYPRAITPVECEAILTWMERSPENALASAGMPQGTRVAHLHGWGRATHADLSLIYGPQADFVLMIYLYQPTWLVWEDAAPTFSTIGQLTYRFFNGDE